MNSHLIIRCFSLCSLFNTFLVVDTWNLDVHHERIFRHPSNTSYFGYSLAAHQFNNKPAGYNKCSFFLESFISDKRALPSCILGGWLDRQAKTDFKERFTNATLLIQDLSAIVYK